MRRAETALLGVPLLLAVLWSAVAMCPALVSEAAEALRGDPFAALSESAVDLCLRVALGRGLLAWLPSGRPGGHAPGELAGTLGASTLLGCAALAPLPHAAVIPAPAAAALFGVAAVLILLRVATLPAAMVPGPPNASEPPSLLASGAGAAAVLVAALLVLAGAGGREELRAAVNGVALAALATHALARLGREPAPRRGVALLLLLTFPLVPRAAGPGAAEAALLCGGALCGLLVRRGTADARMASIAVLGAAGAALDLGAELLRGTSVSVAALAVPLLPAAVIWLGLFAVPPAGRRSWLR